jgi:dUTP pyrophosphatase
MDINIKLLNENAKVPVRNNLSDAGYDLYSTEEGVILAGERKLIKTGISLAIPHGNYGRIAPRSGLAYKSGLDVFAGVIDSTYRGEVGVILFNSSKNDFSYTIGDRIAQIIIEQCFTVDFQEVDGLCDTTRGDSGFGASGMK